MNFKINPICTKCKHKQLISVNPAMYGKSVALRCKNCDNLFTISVPKEEAFLKAKKKSVKPPPIGGTVISTVKGDKKLLKLEVKESQFTVSQLFSVDQKVTIIGRKSPSSNADIQIETTDLHVSRTHLIIEQKANKNFTIADKSSGNGTSVNNTKLDKDEVLYLRDGDIIELGKTKIEVRLF